MRIISFTVPNMLKGRDGILNYDYNMQMRVSQLFPRSRGDKVTSESEKAIGNLGHDIWDTKILRY